MPQYTARFNSITGKSSVHLPGCPCAQRGRGWNTVTFSAPSAPEAAAQFWVAEELQERGFPRTRVARCASKP